MIERGVAQRVQALEAFLDDVYGRGEIMADGVVPRRLVTSSTHYQRAAAGIRPPNGVRVHVAGIDLVRDEHGVFRVLEDNLRTPSGISYVVENRRTMTHVLPELFARQRVRPVTEYPTRLLDALLASAPPGADDPTVVVLTPGRLQLGPLRARVPGPPDGRRAGRGPRPRCAATAWSGCARPRGCSRVDVIYRRIDDDFLDPLQFRWDSLVGVAGILNAARAGNVTLANAVGNGVADDKAVYPYVPKMVEYYFGEKPILPNVPTYDLEDADQRAAVLDRLDRIVCKPVDGSGGYGLVIGPHATDEELAHAARGDRRRPPQLGRPGGRAAVDRADLRRRPPAAPPRRPAPVRGARRRGGVGRARRAHPRRRCPRAASS